MKCPLILLLLASLFSYASLSLDGASSNEDVVVAARRPLPVRPSLKAPEPIRPTTQTAQPVAAPSLFRAAVEPPDANTPQSGETFALVGLAGRETTRLALVRDQADQRVYSLRAGETLHEWTVTEISDRCIALLRRGRTQNLCMS